MWLSRIVYDVRAFLTRRSMDRQLESDIQYHLEREEQLHIERNGRRSRVRRAVCVGQRNRARVAAAPARIGGRRQRHRLRRRDWMRQRSQSDVRWCSLDTLPRRR